MTLIFHTDILSFIYIITIKIKIYIFMEKHFWKKYGYNKWPDFYNVE